MATLYIIAGCNGAGKTTASYTMLPEMLDCKEFVNADGIAAGISPFQPDKVAFEAGRIMLQRINYLINSDIDFSFETTLATKSYHQKIKERVKNGGHNIPDVVVKRRYKRGLKNLFKIYLPLCDYWLIIDNTKTSPTIIAEGNKIVDKSVYNNEIWEQINTYSNEK